MFGVNEMMYLRHISVLGFPSWVIRPFWMLGIRMGMWINFYIS